MAGTFGVGHEVAFHADALLFICVCPALWEEGVRVGEHVRFGLVEDGGHADYGLRSLGASFILFMRRVASFRDMLTPAGISHSLK